MEARLRTGLSMVRIPIGVGDFSLLFVKRPYRPWDPPSLLFNGHQGSFPEIKRPGREVNHSLPPSAKVKNEWICTSTPLMCCHGVDM